MESGQDVRHPEEHHDGRQGGNERAWIMDVTDYMFVPMEEVPGKKQGDDVGNRIGNEIMIDMKDLM